MKLLALVESSDHVCCRYRVRAFESALARHGFGLDCQPLERSLSGRLARLRESGAYEAVLLQRKLLPAWQLAILRRSARYLAFDFDDAVMLRDSYDRRGPRSYARSRRFARTVRAADAVIAGNDYLADCALRAGARPEQVHVIPTCVEPSSYPLARHETEAGSGAIELVWIGSSSTLKGIEQARTVWEHLAGAVAGIRMRMICDRFPDEFPLPLERVLWSQEREAAELARGGVGVSIVPDDDWSRGKCGLKILQYQAAGLPVVANPVGVHGELVIPGETGFLASTVEEWVRAIRQLAEDRGLAASLGERGRRRVEQGYSVAAWSSAFVASATGRSAAAPWVKWAGQEVQAVAGPHSIRKRNRRGSLQPLNPIGD